MLTRMSPAFAVANWVMTHSALFGDHTQMRSPRFESKRQEASRRVNPLLQLAIRPADLLVPDDEGLTVRKALDYSVEMHANRITDKWSVARAVYVTQLRHVKPDIL
jgi:hypothetical protein